MAAETSELTKVDSAVSGISSSPTEKKHPVGGHRRTSSSVTGVFNINDLGELHPSLSFFSSPVTSDKARHLGHLLQQQNILITLILLQRRRGLS